MINQKIHVCGAYLAMATREHLEALVCESDEINIKMCEANFPHTSFSDNKYIKSKNLFPKSYKTRDSFLKHFLESESKAIFLQSPYIDHYPDWFFDLHEVADLAYGGYSLSLIDYFEGQYGSHLIKKSKYLLAGSLDEYENYKKYGREDAVVVLTGNPLMYSLRRELLSSRVSRKENQILLWAPHWIEKWGVDSRGLAHWENAIQSIFIYAERNVNKTIIIRPHPILRIILDTYLNNDSEILNRESRTAALSNSLNDILPIMKKLLDFKNVELSNSSMIEDVLNADMLITEGVSIIGYWAATGKPILILRDSLSVGFNKEGEQLLLGTEQASDVSEILDWIQRTFNYPTMNLNSNLIELSQTIHPTFKKSPIQIMAEYM